MYESLFAKMFAKRAVLCYFLILFLLLSCVLRIAVIATSNYEQISTEQASYKITVARLRGTIYDCNMVPLTNNKAQTVAAIAPTPQAIMQISNKLENDLLKNALEDLKSNKATVCYVDEEISAAGIATTTIYTRDSGNAYACHLIGYTDSTGHGVSGIEQAYDDFLYSNKTTSAIFTADGKGNILKGIDPYFDNDLSIVHSGVVTTVDINIQKIVEKNLSQLNSGCAIVADALSGKIRAIASVPTYDINNIANSLNQNNSPMLNRALCAFNVGSVFKPLVAAFVLDNNVNFTYNCVGNTLIGDRTFRCHNLSGHGEMNLCNALAQSCNCYFYNIALQIGGKQIYKITNSLSIGSKIKIATNFYAAAGNIPTLNSLATNGALANLSIGQGSLTASPIAMLNLYLAIAGNGCYYLPSVVEKTVKDGKETSYNIGSQTRVMSGETALLLRQYLQNVITEGTGVEAQPQSITAAGKTATAQTGRRDENGLEITNSWFCGFFPVEEPKYVVIVMSDSKLNVSTASIFAKIVDGIVEIKGKNGYFAD